MLWTSLEPEYFSTSEIDTVVICNLSGAVQRRAQLDSLMDAFPKAQLKTILWIGEDPTAEPVIHSQVRVLCFRLPSVWDGGHLCFATRHRKHNLDLPGWCALDDLLGGIQRGLYDETWDGILDWCAPGSVDLSMIQKQGLCLRGFPLRIPSLLASKVFSSLFDEGASHSSVDYDWLETEFRCRYFEDDALKVTS